MRGRDQPAERLVVQVADDRPRVDPLVEQGLVAPDVADPGEGVLIEERGRDRQPGTVGVAKPRPSLRGVGRTLVGRQEVRPEAGERGMDRLGARLEQLDDRRVEADGDGTRHLEDEPRP